MMQHLRTMARRAQLAQVRLAGTCPIALSENTKAFLQIEEDFGSFNYHPMEVVLKEAKGVHVYDVDGKEYMDFLSAYSAVNQGHSHPKIAAAAIDQLQKLALTSRAFHNDQLGPYSQKMCELLGFERLLPMNTGAEAVETALKLTRRWGTAVKGIPNDQVKVVVVENCFHGRTFGAISASTDPTAFEQFGPLLPGFIKIPYNNLEALEAAFQDPTVAGFLFEPIQGEAGIIVPDDEYVPGVRALCDKYNVLMVADEVQTGLCRTGKMLAVQHSNVKPDLIILGKALSGGFYPVSAVLGSNEVIRTIHPGEHGSTFGGNPLACRIACAAMDVLVEENLADNAEKMGEIFRSELRALEHPMIAEVRGRGLLNAVVVQPKDGRDAMDVCYAMMERGLLAKPTHGDTIRFACPLVITEPQLRQAVEIIRDALESL
ncbi:MAG: hypothetical protein MHM6MM_003570 [Cercozoa sp. M6MM]